MKSTVVQVRLNDEELRRVDVWRMGCGSMSTRSEIIRTMILSYDAALERHYPGNARLDASTERRNGRPGAILRLKTQ